MDQKIDNICFYCKTVPFTSDKNLKYHEYCTKCKKCICYNYDCVLYHIMEHEFKFIDDMLIVPNDFGKLQSKFINDLFSKISSEKKNLILKHNPFSMLKTSIEIKDDIIALELWCLFISCRLQKIDYVTGLETSCIISSQCLDTILKNSGYVWKSIFNDVTRIDKEILKKFKFQKDQKYKIVFSSSEYETGVEHICYIFDTYLVSSCYNQHRMKSSIIDFEKLNNNISNGELEDCYELLTGDIWRHDELYLTLQLIQ